MPLAICVARVEKEQSVHVLRLALNVLLVLGGLGQLIQGVAGHGAQRLRPPYEHIIVDLLAAEGPLAPHRPQRTLRVQPAPQLRDARDPLQLVYLLLSHLGGGDRVGRLTAGR